MLIKNKIKYVGLDIKTGEFKYLKENRHSDLLDINKKGFNIYEILNDFYSERKENNVVGVNMIWIDLDYYSKGISELLEECDRLLWFLPVKVNITYKWYHLYFSLDSELYSMELNSYKKLYSKVNSLLSGDTKMRSVTGILKVEWFKDLKDSRDFIIRNIYSNEDNLIFKRQIEKLLCEKVKFNLEREEKYKDRILKKERNNSLFKDIDWLDLIKEINNSLYNWLFTKEITISKTGKIDKTNWLKLHNINWFYEIKDFSGKGRHWIKWFLFNYVLKNEEFENKNLFRWLSESFWIKLNKWIKTHKPIYDSMFETSLQKNTFELTKDEEIEVEVLEAYNNTLIDLWTKWWLQSIVIWLNLYCEENKFDLTNYIDISENSLLDILGYSKSDKNKKNLRKNLLLLSNLNIPLTVRREDGNVITRYKRLFEYWIYRKWKKVYFEIRRTIKNKKKLWISPNTLKVIKKPERISLAITIQSNISQFWSCNLNTEKVCKDLKIKSSLQIRELLKKMKDEKMIKEFSFSKTTIYIN